MCQSDEYLRVEKESIAVPFSEFAEHVEGLLSHSAMQLFESCQLSMVLCLELTVVNPDKDSDGCCD